MTVLILGYTGVVGAAVLPELDSYCQVYGVSKSSSSHFHRGFDLTLVDEVKLLKATLRHEIDVIVNLSGIKDIKWCERNKEACNKVNVEIVRNILNEFPKAHFIQLSTDYIFDGLNGNYSWNSPSFPKTYYGKTKKYAEDLILSSSERYTIIRASAIYHENSSFIKYIRTTLEKGERIEAYTDVMFTPTFYLHLVGVIKGRLRDPALKRILNVCDKPLSRYEFAIMVCNCLGFDSNNVVPITYTSNGILFKNLTMIDSGFLALNSTQDNLKNILV